MHYLSISGETIPHKPLVVPGGSIQRNIERFKLCNIMTYVENRVILRTSEPGKVKHKKIKEELVDLLGVVGGELVVDKDLAVERLSTQHRAQSDQIRLVGW